MYVIDTHCDALYKLQQSGTLSFMTASTLQASGERLRRGNVKVQCFAIFLDRDIPVQKRWHATLEQIDIFHEKVIGSGEQFTHITDWRQLRELAEEEIGAVLTLEGAESFGTDINKLDQLYEAGILSIGLTWNYANDCGVGVLERNRSGLTTLGFEVIRRNNERRVLTDVAHINERGFWDIMESAEYPFCSHGNCATVCPHPRNLTDEQLRALIEREAPIHLAFYPPFIHDASIVHITDLIRHIEHICSLGGAQQVGFGSDFDGIDEVVNRLEHAAHYEVFIDELLNYYSEELVRQFCHQNFENYIETRVL
ncbi:MAG TPA: dipeptidase [Pseudogracilibacillus sp.]|nr:dipeptidase [Pseudogracilibacillus sp.]